MESLQFRAPDERVRLEIAGGRVVTRDGFAEVVPDISRADMSRLQFGTMPHQVGLEGMVSDLFPAGSREAKDFFSTRKVVERKMPNGDNLVSVTSNVWEKINQPSVLGMPAASDRWIAGKGQRRVYELAQVLTDSYLLDKFALTSRQIATTRTMAVVNATSAASYLQSTLRETPEFAKYEVTAGKYARSRKWAKDSVQMIAAGMPPPPVRVEAAVIGEKLFLYGPEDSLVRWSVFGPVWYAGELRALYSIVSVAGPAQASFALGIETTLLDLDITSGGAVMCPTVTLHVGPQDILPVRSSSITQGLLSAMGRSRITAMVDQIEPVLVDGVQMACAVRVTKSRVLVNTHVMQSGDDVKVGGVPVSPQRLISKDLWVASCNSPGFQAEWLLRAPEQGEQVVVCYLRGDSVQCTSPMSVRTSDGVTVVMSLTSDLCAGMSGGAIVSLHDFALLGVYSGSGAQQAVGAVFSQEHYTDLCTSDAASEVLRQGASLGADSVYSRLRSRGLGKMMDKVIESIQPLFDGQVHVGMGYQLGNQFRTTCDVDALPLTVGLSKRNLIFRKSVRSVYVADEGFPIDGAISVVRQAQFGEKVVVVGRDTEGPYLTEPTSVRHIGVAGQSFFVSSVAEAGDLPLHGGLVVAMADGAVVGQYETVVSSVSMGPVARCVGVELIAASPRVGVTDTVTEWLGRTFPMLNVGTWPIELLDEVFVHSSVGGYSDSALLFNAGAAPLAYVGDAVAKLAVGMSLRAHNIPHSQWQVHIQSLQTDKAIAARCEEVGLSKWIRVGKGVRLPSGCKAYATLYEALLGAVYMQETFATVQQFAVASGFVSDGYVAASPETAKAALDMG